MLVTDVDQLLWGRSIEPARRSAGFHVVLDTAQPWGGGRIEGRLESRKARQSGRYDVSVSCSAAWLDCAPPPPGEIGTSAGPGSVGAVASNLLLHGIGIRIWLDERVWEGRADLGELSGENWLPFAFDLPSGLPRAFEGTLAAFRWRVTARRRRAVGHAEVSFPLIIREDRPLPTVRIETTPIGTWRLKDRRSDLERDSAGGGCSVRYEDPAGAGG
jgi:hypothetical protein